MKNSNLGGNLILLSWYGGLDLNGKGLRWV